MVVLISYKRGQTSIILRVKIRNSSVSTGAGLTGLTHSSTGLKISTIADNEATATTYTVAGSTIETITTLGTFATPTATKCRFKEVDATNHPGIYEIQLDNTRFAVSSSKSLLISISGATNAAECGALIPLTDLDLYDSVRAGLTGLANATPGSAGGLLIAGTNSGATSFTSGVTISSSTDYALQVTCTANSKAAVRLRGNAAATHGIIVEAIGSGDSRAATFLSSTGATTIGITGPDIGAGILLEAGVNGTAITLNGGDNIVDKPVILIDNPYVTGTGIQISGTGGPSTGIKIDTNGTAVNLVGTNTSAIVITASGTTNYCAEVTSTTSQGSIIITSTQGVGLNVKGATDGGIFQSTATGNGLTLTRDNSSYNDLNLTNNDSGTWPTVQGYASGQAPLQPTVAGRTLNVSATGLADADLKALNGNTTTAINQANAAIAVYSGTVTSSPTTTTLRDTGLTQVDSNFWNGRVIIFTSGGLKYQGAKITAFDPSTDQLTFDAMTSALSVSNTYIIV